MINKEVNVENLNMLYNKYNKSYDIRGNEIKKNALVKSFPPISKNNKVDPFEPLVFIGDSITSGSRGAYTQGKSKGLYEQIMEHKARRMHPSSVSLEVIKKK